MQKFTHIFITSLSALALSACGGLQQDFTAPNSVVKSQQSESQNALCAMVMVPMFNPNSSICVEATDACEAHELKREGFTDLSISEYCDLGCPSDSCKD